MPHLTGGRVVNGAMAMAMAMALCERLRAIDNRTNARTHRGSQGHRA
jgi:hypothetical protein